MTTLNNINILGISFGHGDSSAALVCNNKLVAAVEEERFDRIKHSGLFPSNSIEYCLQHAGIKPSDVHKVVIARKPLVGLAQRIQIGIENPEWFKRWFNTPRSQMEPVKVSLRKLGITRAKIVHVEHHIAHAMSGVGIYDEPCSILSFDGLGDFVSTLAASYTDRKVHVWKRVFFPHSLGYFYSAMTQHLGFLHFGDEYKVMGLSSYGTPRFSKVMQELVREDDSFGFHLNLEAFPIIEKPIEFSISNGAPSVVINNNYKFLTQVLGVAPRKPHDEITKDHWDLAKSVQVRFEEVANSLLRKLYEKTQCENLVLAGGCAHNSVWVGKILRNTKFKKVTLAPASHDAGLAVGAAVWANKQRVEPENGSWALLGPTASEFLEVGSFQSCGKKYKDDDALIKFLTPEILQGKIIGLFHGRMEFGPRALGCRSIICDPRPPDMRNRLNARIKHRELFRPFAASVLEEQQDKWFEDSFYAPTMEAVFNVKPALREKISAVTHIDGSCRIQSVSKVVQPFYWKLIHAFYKVTSVPMLLNTSFNDCEPIVCSPTEAWNCFKNTEMDYLVIDDTVFDRLAIEKLEVKKTG